MSVVVIHIVGVTSIAVVQMQRVSVNSEQESSLAKHDLMHTSFRRFLFFFGLQKCYSTLRRLVGECVAGLNSLDHPLHSFNVYVYSSRYACSRHGQHSHATLLSTIWTLNSDTTKCLANVLIRSVVYQIVHFQRPDTSGHSRYMNLVSRRP